MMIRSPLNLLLADDDLDDCTFFREALDELPVCAHLVTVNDGVQLMDLLNKEEEQLPDALYLDLNMPRKNGFDCLTEIRSNEKLKQLPVIIFSTSMKPDVVNLLRHNGADYYICKPPEFSNLKNIILRSINLISGGDGMNDQKEKFVLTPVRHHE